MTDQQQANKELIRTAFDQWAAGTGGPFGVLADDATWTIVGNSPVSRTYHSRQEFLDVVIDPFNARMSERLVPSVRHVFADGDWVIVLFDAHATARDGKPYDNTYTWHMRLDGNGDDTRIVEVVAFFDTIEFTDFWNRVSPD
jgi:uncharacterized protein